jgi:hypothetical protein
MASPDVACNGEPHHERLNTTSAKVTAGVPNQLVLRRLNFGVDIQPMQSLGNWNRGSSETHLTQRESDPTLCRSDLISY